MPKQMAVIDYSQCRPEDCKGGVCQAALSCPHRLLQQDEVFEPPEPNPGLCRGCAMCVVACPRGAVHLM